MTLYLERWKGWFRWVRLFIVPIFLEIALTIASFRLSAVLLSDQRYFDNHRPYYDFIMSGPLSNEWKLGGLALFAACAKAVGISIMLFRRWPAAMEAAFMLRQLGWGLSALLWGALMVSIGVAGDFASVGSILATAACMFSIGGMIGGPIMPDEINEPR